MHMEVAGLSPQGVLVDLRLRQPLGLGPPVLEPDLDLRLREAETLGEVRPLRDGKVALLQVLGLKLVQLRRAERRPGLAVRPVLPQGALEGKLGHVHRHLSRALVLELAEKLILKKWRHKGEGWSMVERRRDRASVYWR